MLESRLRLALLLATSGALVAAAASTPASTPDAPASAPASAPDSPEWWRARKAEFYRNTSFPLSDFQLQLLGRKRTIFEDKSALPRGHLPFWFDYQLFKRVFNKPDAGEPGEELRRHQAYISACLRAIKKRTLFRMLAGTRDTLITSDADQFYWEKFGHLAAPPRPAEGELFVLGALEPAAAAAAEAPLERAIRLMRAEMNIVESKNQVETYLKAFNEIDGSALDGKLPY